MLESHQRERVLERATPIFAKRGYQGTTVDDLLATGKVGVGNFYSLFEGKEDCFLAAFERTVAIAPAAGSPRRAETDGWGERTYLGLRALIEVMLADPLEPRAWSWSRPRAPAPRRPRRYNALLDEAIAWHAGRPRVTRRPRDLPAGLRALGRLRPRLLPAAVPARPAPPRARGALREAAELVLEPIFGAAELRRLATRPAATV